MIACDRRHRRHCSPRPTRHRRCRNRSALSPSTPRAVVAVEMIGREVGEHADLRLEVRAVVQLERRELERHPRRRRGSAARRRRAASRCCRRPSRRARSPPCRCADERGGGRLAVGAGDRRRNASPAVRRTRGRSRRAPAPRPPSGGRDGGASGGTPGATTTSRARAMRARSCPPSSTSRPRRAASPAQPPVVSLSLTPRRRPGRRARAGAGPPRRRSCRGR